MAYGLSPNESNKIWVACSDARIFSIDWTTGERQFWATTATSITQMALASVKGRDIIFTAGEIDETWKITAHDLELLESSRPTQSRVVYSSTQPIQILRIVGEDPVIVAASGKNVLVGGLKSSDIDSVDQMRYEMMVFESSDVISSLDARVSTRASDKDILLGRKKARKFELKVVDVVVGDVKGAIFVHNDLLGNLRRSQVKNNQGGLVSSVVPINLVPRKLHWHRKMVAAAKWSLDGMLLFLIQTSAGAKIYRQLYYIWWQRDDLSFVAAGYRPQSISPSSVRGHCQHCGLSEWNIICGTSR